MAARNTTLDDISSIIGFTATITLSAWFGNGKHSLYIPLKVEAGMLLPRLVGLSAARALVAAWPGEYIVVPAMTAYEEEARKRFIARLLEQGFGPTEIGRRLRMSERRVQQIQRALESIGLIEVLGPVMEKHDAKILGKKVLEKCPTKTPHKTAPSKKAAPRRTVWTI